MRLILQDTQTITHLVVGNNIEDKKHASMTLFQWFYDNQMKASPVICRTDDKVNIIVENRKICNSSRKKL